MEVIKAQQSPPTIAPNNRPQQLSDEDVIEVEYKNISELIAPENTELANKQKLNWNLDACKVNPTNPRWIKKNFDGVASDGKAKDLRSNKPEDNAFFKKKSGNDIVGCFSLTVNELFSQNKYWQGDISWLWTFTSGDEGFIIANRAETTDNGKIKVIGVLNLIRKKGGTGNDWEIAYEAKSDEANDIDFKDIDKYLPKPEKKPASTVWWNNRFGAEAILCSDVQCKKGKTFSTLQNWSKKWAWTTDGSTEQSLKDWSENMDWWTNLYSGVNKNWDLLSKIEGFRGKWKMLSYKSPNSVVAVPEGWDGTSPITIPASK